jgi:glycosyltransferase involved in cell wall biosynthesis
MKVVAIIPAYNEEKTIGKIIRKTRKYVDKVIVVDDGSTDLTFKIAEKAGAKVIRYPTNLGVLYATKTGIKEALKDKADIIINLDSDGQHNPKDIPKFISKIKKGYDYVYGKRNISNYPLSRKIGNLGLTILANLFCPSGIKDTECGYRAFTRKAAKKIKLYTKLNPKLDNKPKGYEREMNFVYEVWRNKFKIGRVDLGPTVFYSKKAVFRGFRNFFWFLKKRFNFI